MAKTSRKTLTFPSGGVDRQAGYRRQTRPFSSPYATNVRGTGPLEVRDRGGSRPGLAKVSTTDFGGITAIVPLTYVDASDDRQHSLIVIGDGAFYDVQGATATVTDADLLLEDEPGSILAENGDTIVFDSTVDATNAITDTTDAYSACERGGKLYLADSVLRVYDPVTGVVDPVLATEGTVPTGQPLICLYRDRIILAGADHVWYASRQNDPGDWAFGAEMGDEGKAVAGQVGEAGQIGDVITAVIPIQDTALVFGSANGLWVMRGDPATGRLEHVSGENGVIAPQAWAMSPDGTLAYLSNDGVYLWHAGSQQAPVRFSEERVPNELRDVATTNTITMAYDAIGRGFHLSITPETETGEHWWLDLEHKAMWPVVFQAANQPTASTRLTESGLSEIIFGGRDGYLRRFDASSGTDDDVAIESHVLIGPIHVAASDTKDSLMAELHGIMGDSADVYEVTGTISPDLTGTFVQNGTYGGKPAYELQGGGAWLWYSAAPAYFLSVTKGGTVAEYWSDGETVEGTYDPYNGATGTVTVTAKSVIWRLVMGDSAEAVTDVAVAGVLAAVAGTAVSGVAASGTWGAGRNRVDRPRARGSWAVVWIEGGGRWAYEAVATVTRQFGRLRYG